MKKLIIIILFISGLFNSGFLYAQLFEIFLDDSVYYEKRKDSRLAGEYNLKLKDSLADGKWVLHDIYKKDSLKANDETIILCGEFKNGKKNGVFNFYRKNYYNNKKKLKDEKYIDLSQTYINDTLHGLEIKKIIGFPGVITSERETHYEKGKKHGIELIYNIVGSYAGNLRSVSIYRNDTLWEWYNYYPEDLKVILGHGKRLSKNQDFIYTTYALKGYIDSKYYFEDGRLIRYEKFHENQVCAMISEGEFAPCRKVKGKLFFYQWDIIYFDCNLELINGTEQTFDNKGKLIKEIHYNNSLIEK
jgi:hypothetical protein